VIGDTGREVWQSQRVRHIEPAAWIEALIRIGALATAARELGNAVLRKRVAEELRGVLVRDHADLIVG